MGDNGVACGHCGVLNEAGTQFCVGCGVLLAAYQSPSGARSSAVESQPDAPMPQDVAAPPIPGEPEPPPEPAAESAAEPAVAREPEPAPEEKDVDDEAQSVDDVFGSLSEVDDRLVKSASVPTDSTPMGPQPDVPGEAPAARPRLDADDAIPPAASDESIDAVGRQETTTGPIDIESRPLDVPARPITPPFQPPSSRWDTSEQGQGAFGVPGQRVSTIPPQTLVVIGGALILASCVLTPFASVVDLPFIFEGPMWCAFPVGVIVLVIGLIQLASRRPNRF
ncbi:MAG: hypothetical protein ACRDJW_21110 [Thermomicrobiales bacterium]